jgi:hypothetical protein
MAIDAFIKFEGLEGEAHKVSRDFHKLGDGFADLGGAFLKLVDDVTDIDFLKTNAAHIKHDLFAIDQNFVKIGEDFLKFDGPLHKFDDAIVKFTDQFIKVTPSDSEGVPTFAADFMKYETDVKITGLDFLKAASDAGPTENLSLTYNKIAIDYTKQSDDALKISADVGDFLKISGISDSSELGATFHKFADDWNKIGADYLKLSTDFQKIAGDFLPTGDSGPLKFDQVVAQHPDDFVKLAGDLKLTDADLGALGGGFHKLAETFENATPVIVPTTKG